MNTQAGWYPDPGGAPGKFRYWDGRQWTVALSADPTAPPPRLPGQAGGAPLPGQAGPASRPGAADPYVPYAPYGPVPPVPEEPRSRRTAAAWWLGAGAVLVVLVLLISWAVRLGTGQAPWAGGAGSQPTTQVCPPGSSESPGTPAQPADGRVHGGALSFPLLAPPFGPVVQETEVPFATHTYEQMVVVEPLYNGRNDWVAPVMVGDLVAGDGFFSPQDGARVVVNCIVDRFYGDSTVTRHDVRNSATTIDGHDAWLVESQLSFDVPGLRTKGELMIVAIVSTGPSSSGIFYASIPDTRPDLVPAARQALAQLRVDG